jgi:sulfur relay (sulfurtransferase) DsrC/TusE family protein
MDAVTSAYVLDSHTFEHDEEGYLKNLSEWNKELAELIAKDEKIG